MPHKPAICTYCNKPMSIERVHPSMTPYHGECRLEHLRHLWPTASPAQRHWHAIEAETLTRKAWQTST